MPLKDRLTSLSLSPIVRCSLCDGLDGQNPWENMNRVPCRCTESFIYDRKSFVMSPLHASPSGMLGISEKAGRSVGVHCLPAPAQAWKSSDLCDSHSVQRLRVRGDGHAALEGTLIRQNRPVESIVGEIKDSGFL